MRDLTTKLVVSPSRETRGVLLRRRERKWTGKLKETEGKKMAGGVWGPGGREGDGIY